MAAASKKTVKTADAKTPRQRSAPTSAEPGRPRRVVPKPGHKTMPPMKNGFTPLAIALRRARLDPDRWSRGHKMTQADAADWFARKARDRGEAGGVSQPSYGRWENGQDTPDQKRWNELAEFLGISVQQVWELASDQTSVTTFDDLVAEQRAIVKRVTRLEEEQVQAVALLQQLLKALKDDQGVDKARKPNGSRSTR